MESKKVLFISQEVFPYVPETPMSQLGCEIPQSVHGREFEVRIFTPKYGCINERRNQLHEVIRLSGLNIPIDDNDHPLIIKVATLLPSRMQVYFIDNDDYFHPMSGRGLEIVEEPDDNDERLMFFTSGVIETVKKLRWQPAVIHCSGWVSSLAPLYLRTRYADDPTFRSSKIIYSLEPERFDGVLDSRFVEKLKLSEFPAEVIDALSDSPVDYITLNKIAIDNADALMQVTADIDPEILDYAVKSGKPMLPVVPADDLKDALTDFYRSLLETEDDD